MSQVRGEWAKKKVKWVKAQATTVNGTAKRHLWPTDSATRLPTSDSWPTVKLVILCCILSWLLLVFLSGGQLRALSLRLPSRRDDALHNSRLFTFRVAITANNWQTYFHSFFGSRLKKCSCASLKKIVVAPSMELGTLATGGQVAISQSHRQRRRQQIWHCN